MLNEWSRSGWWASNMFCLTLLAACGDPPTGPVDTDEADQSVQPPPVGDLAITFVQVNLGTDRNGATITFTHSATKRASVVTGTIPGFRDVTLEVGSYSYEVSDLDPRCEAFGDPTVDISEGQNALTISFDCVGAFTYQRWISRESNQVWWVDEGGLDRPLATEGFNIARGFSPDGSSVLVEEWIGRQCKTSIVSLDGGRIQITPMFGASVSVAEWSPDGSMLVAQEADACSGPVFSFHIVFYDKAGRATGFVPKEGQSIDLEPAWSPNGKTIAFTRGRSLMLYWLESQRLEVVRTYGTSRPITRPEWSPDGTKLLLEVSEPQQLHVIDLATRSVVEGRRDHPALGPSWYPDSRRIIYGTLNDEGETLWSFDSETGTTTMVLTDGPSGAASPSLSVDGRQVVFDALSDGGGRAILFANLKDGRSRVIHQNTGSYYILPRLRRCRGPSAMCVARGLVRATDTTAMGRVDSLFTLDRAPGRRHGGGLDLRDGRTSRPHRAGGHTQETSAVKPLPTSIR